MIYTRRNTCRVCDATLAEVLDLGEHYLSGFHDPGADKGPRVPLVLTRCMSCGLVQLRDTTNPDLLFLEQYWYRSDVNESMRQALADIAHEAETITDLQPGDCVLDIGANVGTLLLSYTRPGIRKIACEPAQNLRQGLHELWEARKIDGVLPFFFQVANPDVTQNALNPDISYRIITAIAMMYDVDTPMSFLRDVKKVLAPDGLFIVQMSYLGAMIHNGGYDVICHEHLETWSTSTFREAVREVGLDFDSWTYNSVNGGSVRYYITHADLPADHPVYQRIPERSADHEFNEEGCRDWMENTWAIGHPKYCIRPLEKFAESAAQNRLALLGALYDLKRQGKTVYALAASTKFNTVLQYCDIGPDLIQAIAERDPRKHGKVTPTDIPIISEEQARACNPDVFVLGAWQFKDMLIEREAEYLRNQAHKFLVPFPTPHFVGG